MKHSSLILLLGMIFFNACAGVDRGNFGYFEHNLNKTHSYRVLDDPRKNASFKKIESFEVRPGDCSHHRSGWGLCKKDRESSELREKNRDTHPGDEYWYGWSIYFPADFPNVYPTKTILIQFIQKKPSDSDTIWEFDNSRRGYNLKRLEGDSIVESYALIGEKDLRCRWHKIEVHARWAKNATGFFRVWINGIQKVDYRGKTMDARKDALKVYLRYGIRRIRVSNYKNRFNKEIPTQRVYFANVKRGNSRRELRAQPGL